MKNFIQANAKYVFKAILFCMVFIGLLFVFTSSLSFLPGYLVHNKFEGAYKMIGVFVGFLTTKIFLLYDKKQFADIGFSWDRNTLVNFLKGVIIGIVLMGLVAGTVIYFSDAGIKLNQKSNLLNFLLASVPIFLNAFMEEIGFRAYPLQVLNNKVGIRIAILLTSILFALAHIIYGWTIANSFGPAIWGLIFGLAAIYSKGIAMPTGIHYALNLTTSAIGSEDNTVNLWTIQQSNTSSVNLHGIDWVTVLPHIVVLVFAVICIEIYIRRRTITPASLTIPKK